MYVCLYVWLRVITLLLTNGEPCQVYCYVDRQRFTHPVISRREGAWTGEVVLASGSLSIRFMCLHVILREGEERRITRGFPFALSSPAPLVLALLLSEEGAGPMSNELLHSK